MTPHRSLAAVLLLLGATGGANAQLLYLSPTPPAWAPAAPQVVLVPGTSQAVVGHGPVLLAPPQAPHGSVPGSRHPLVRTWAIPVGSIPVSQAQVFQAPAMAPAPVAMHPGVPPVLWPQQPRRALLPGLTPGASQGGLDVEQARNLATGTLQNWPDANVDATWDVALGRWTVQHRFPQNGSSGGNGP